MLPYNKRLKELSRELRKNMTDAEKLIWSRIRRKQLKGYQFYGQHYSKEGTEKDKVRDNYVSRLGFTVLRFSDREVFKNINGVLERIYEHL
jgi:very-short-patch-repair endonuclease